MSFPRDRREDFLPACLSLVASAGAATGTGDGPDIWTLSSST